MKQVLLTLMLLIVSFPAFAEGKESAYDRILRTGEIRCGYVVWAPMFMKDPNTAQFSGIFYEYMEQLGKALSLKVNWTEEVTPAGYVEALQSDRFDMLCSADWPNSTRGKYLDYADPIFYLALYPFVRGDDLRFDNKPELLNNENVTFSVIDGEMSSIIARTDFPNAKTLELPQMSDASQMLMNVVNKKADVAVTALTTGLDFQKNNPDTIRRVPLSSPVRLFPNTLSMKLGEDKLRQMMNTATRELLYNGSIDRIITKYEEYPGSLYRVAKPYEMEK